MIKFYSPDGLKAIALYLDELFESGSVTQRRLAEESGITAGTIGNLRTNRANSGDQIVRKMEPEIILSLAPYIPDPRSLVYDSSGRIDYDRSPKFANPEDLLLMARGIIPLKKPQRQAESSLSLWLKNQMIERGLNPSGLAELLELPEQRVHELFNGQPPTPSECIFMAEELADSDTAMVFKLAGADLNAPIKCQCH